MLDKNDPNICCGISSKYGNSPYVVINYYLGAWEGSEGRERYLAFGAQILLELLLGAMLHFPSPQSTGTGETNQKSSHFGNYTPQGII